MHLECFEVEDPKTKYMGVKKHLFVNPETKGFIIGFVATTIASVLSLYIFNQYIANKAASVAIEKYAKQQQQLSPKNIHKLSESDKLAEWKPLTSEEIKSIQVVNNA